jgi:serine/threonine protein kinase
MAQLIGNRYELIKEIGAGGMGIVYCGLDTQTQQAVAIKQLKTEISSPDGIERFKREGEALRQLNHPNIVKMIDTVEQDGEQYLVLEYVQGGDLNSLLKQGRMPLDRLLSIALELADALTRAHLYGGKTSSAMTEAIAEAVGEYFDEQHIGLADSEAMIVHPNGVIEMAGR